MDTATQWGLPEGFVPVRFPIDDGVKDVVRGVLQPNEPVIATLANEGDTIFIVATPFRLMSVRAGTAGGAGVTGFNVREFPWEGITNLVLQQAALNVKVAVHFKSKDGRTVELGRKAKLSKDAVDNLMPFESNAGGEVFQAIHAVWEHKMALAAQQPED